MRIIAGKFRGRKILGPKDRSIRPTTDRLRESIFGAITSRVGNLEGLRVADVFAGTGAFGLEALSRGASSVEMVEKHFASLELLRQNIELLGVGGRADILPADDRTLPRRGTPFDLIFLDPPYGRGLASPTLISLAASGWIGPATLIVVERGEKDAFEIPETLEEIKVIKQGKRRAHFLNLKG